MDYKERWFHLAWFGMFNTFLEVFAIFNYFAEDNLLFTHKFPCVLKEFIYVNNIRGSYIIISSS